jgi:hypothetical protein
VLLSRVTKDQVVDERKKGMREGLGREGRELSLKKLKGTLPGLEFDRQKHSEEAFVIIFQVYQGGKAR